MKIKMIIIVSFVTITAIIQSCVTAYVPNRVNTPLFTEKGEIKIDAALGTNGADIQAAYSPVKHLGIIASGNFSIQSYDTATSFHKHSYGEIGMGYYNKLNNNLVMEIYGGYGMGNSDTEWSSIWLGKVNIIDVKDDFSKFFIQPAIAIQG